MNSNPIRPNTINLVFVVYLVSTKFLISKSKNCWLGIRIKCRSGATCPPSDSIISLKGNLFLQWYFWNIGNNHSLLPCNIIANFTINKLKNIYIFSICYKWQAITTWYIHISTRITWSTYYETLSAGSWLSRFSYISRNGLWIPISPLSSSRLVRSTPS